MRSFFRLQALIVGIDTASRRMVTLRKGRRRWHVQSVHETMCQPEGEALVVTALPTRDVLVRPLDLPLKKEKDIAAALEFQVEPLLPFPVSEAIVQIERLETHSLGTRLTVIAAQKERVEAHLAAFDLMPERVTATPLALAALTKMMPTTDRPMILIHFGPEEGTCVLVEEGKLLAARGFALMEIDLRKALLALGNHRKAQEVEDVVMLGNTSFPKELIEEIVEKPATVARGDFQEYGLATGIAMAAASDKAPNFRQNEYAFPKPWKRYRKPLLTYALLVCIFCGGLFGLERCALTRKAHALDQELASLQAFEGEKGDLKALRKTIEARPDTFPLHPTLPKVSDLLSWLSAHPGLQEIEISELQYTMTKRPTLEKPHEKYAAEVSLRFAAPSPSLAHALQEALLTTNLFVDTKKEVSLSSSQGIYHCRFTLKDKTRYR